MSNVPHRLYFALCPDPVVRDALIGAARGLGLPGKPVPPERLHLTLRFLGTWPASPDDAIERARRAGDAVACAPFHLVVDRAGHFDTARVAWLGPAGSSGLDALWSALGHALEDVGLECADAPEFVPHVTVARGVTAHVEATVDPISWPVTEFALLHSHAGAHRTLATWPLH